MPFFSARVRRALPAVLLLFTLARAQTCYYPSGSIATADTPCSPNTTASSCCSPESYCLQGGFCLTGGLTTRASCTDNTWNSPECAASCKTVDPSGEIGISPCSVGLSDNTFVCGLENSDCSDASKTFTLPSDGGIILRPLQIEYLISHALSSGQATAPAVGSTGFSVGTVAGTAAGIAVPLLIAIGVLAYLYVRERRRSQIRNNMYKLPDHETKESLEIRPPPSLFGSGQRRAHSTRSSSHHVSRPSSRAGSDHVSLYSHDSRRSPRPSQINLGAEVQRPFAAHRPSVQSYSESVRASHMASLAERIESMKVTPQLVDVRDTGSSRHELDSSPSTPRKPFPPSRLGSTDRYPMTPKEVERYELASSRLSR